MAVREILKMGDPRLLRVAQIVTAFDTDALHLLITDLLDTQDAALVEALSRLRRHDRKGCREILRDITSQNPRYAQAQSLLQRI